MAHGAHSDDSGYLSWRPAAPVLMAQGARSEGPGCPSCVVSSEWGVGECCWPVWCESCPRYTGKLTNSWKACTVCGKDRRPGSSLSWETKSRIKVSSEKLKPQTCAISRCGFSRHTLHKKPEYKFILTELCQCNLSDASEEHVETCSSWPFYNHVCTPYRISHSYSKWSHNLKDANLARKREWDRRQPENPTPRT